MDPNATLAELRRLVDRTRERMDAGYPELDDALRMTELIHALDEWLSHGGFLPSQWSR